MSRNGRPVGTKNKTFHRWSIEEKEYLKEICFGKSYKEITEIMQKKFNREYTVTQIDGVMRRNGLKSCIDASFKKGNEPWNKGMKGLTFEGCKATQFKKGHPPVNYRQVGSERVTIDGYTEIKVSDPNKWELKHRILYREYHGEIPKGHVVIFADRDKSNFNKENLIAISRNKLKVMNRNNLIKNNSEITEVGSVIANIVIKIQEVKKKRS